MDLTIVIPCCEPPLLVALSIERNKEIYFKYPMVVVNKQGGELFKTFSPHFFQQDSSFWFARRFGLEFVETKYVLCLDVDTILSPQYIENAIELLEKDPKIGAVTAEYAEPYNNNHHRGFGNSIWRTELLKKLYDWRLTPDQQFSVCECKYMWNKLEKIGLKVETLPIQAIHLRNSGAPKIVHS